MKFEGETKGRKRPQDNENVFFWDFDEFLERVYAYLIISKLGPVMMAAFHQNSFELLPELVNYSFLFTFYLFAFYFLNRMAFFLDLHFLLAISHQTVNAFELFL